VPVHYYAIQELNTGEGTTIPQKAASAWKKYELQNQGQAGQITTPQSDESGNNGVIFVIIVILLFFFLFFLPVPVPLVQVFSPENRKPEA